jgi:DNA-binding NarL/FixJ family response regulator
MSLAPDRITILLVDDHTVVRAGLRAMLSDPDFEVVGEAGDGAEGIERAIALRPTVVLMDLQMPGTDGIAATQKIKLASPSTNVVVLTTFETEADVSRAVAAGAIGYLLKDSPRAAIVDAVRAAAKGRATFSPEAATHLVNRARGDMPLLSKRELDVLERVAKGASNREIASALRVSEATVKTHLLHVFEKLGVNDRTAAVTVAIERKLLRI